MNFNEILKRDDMFRYRLLSRMKSDCDYYLGNGGHDPKHLLAGNEVDHIAYMKALWNSFGENDKPEWLTLEQVLDYEQKIGVKAILVEAEYKGDYKRLALTPDEFDMVYPQVAAMYTYANSWPIKKEGTATVHTYTQIRFTPCVVGDDNWERFFTDMKWRLPERDIESGNLACIDYNLTRSLNKYLKDITEYHCRAAFHYDNRPFAGEEIEMQLFSAMRDAHYGVSNFRCVEGNKAEVGEKLTDDYVFTFEFDVNLPRNSIVNINKILDCVDGGELISVSYERSADKPSLDAQAQDAAEQASVGTVKASDENIPKKFAYRENLTRFRYSPIVTKFITVLDEFEHLLTKTKMYHVRIEYLKPRSKKPVVRYETLSNEQMLEKVNRIELRRVLGYNPFSTSNTTKSASKSPPLNDRAADKPSLNEQVKGAAEQVHSVADKGVDKKLGVEQEI